MNKDILKILISAFIILMIIILPIKNSVIVTSLYLLSYIIVGAEVIEKAIKNIAKGKIFDENFLMMVATIGAILIHEYPEAVAVMLLYQIGEYFQDNAIEKSKKSIVELMNIRPDFANVIRNGETIKVNPEEVNISETILVKPGEKIPLDGIVIEGNSTLDVSSLTGEAIEQKVEENSEVLSGTINKSGMLKIKVTKEFKESTASKIIDLVENASSKKAKSENFITKFSKYYTPIVVVIAVLLAIVPTLIMGEETLQTWIYRALSFLVVSCPCSLVISIPLSFFAGIGNASTKGILIKGSNYLEALSKADIVVFDKTGTLTEGVFEVQKVVPNDISKEDLIKLVAHAENYSNHPIANSIKRAYNKEIEKEKITDVKEIAGFGISAKVQGQNILVGNSKLMEENSIDYKQSEEIGTIIYVAIEKSYSGYILISDKLKRRFKKCSKITKRKRNKRNSNANR